MINYDNLNNQVISGVTINGSTGACITLTNCSNIHITNCRLLNTNNRGIYLYNCSGITIDSNHFYNLTTGVLADHCKNDIVIKYNLFLNMVGAKPSGQFVQLNTLIGSGCSISYNKCENVDGFGNPEDAINVYMSNGTSKSPITINGNWIRGGGKSLSGGGIMLGDTGGAYQIAMNNILVNPGQYGIAIAGGNNLSLINNQVYAKSQFFTNVGLYVDGIGGYNVTNATVSGNSINYFNSANQINNYWIAPGTNQPVGWNNLPKSNIDETILPIIIISGI